MPEDPNQIEVNVVLSGQHATSVKPLSSDQNVNVTLSGQQVSLTQLGDKDVTVQLPGVQGPPGFMGGHGEDGAVQYNDGGVQYGADTLFYQSETDTVLVSGGALVVNDGDFIISGDPLSASQHTFSIKDSSKNIIQVDSANKRIVLSQNTGPSEYYIGIGTNEPEEKLHLKNGNMRVDGDIIASGNVVPAEDAKFDLGSPTAAWKDLYLDGDSIIFENQESKISVEKGRFSFFSKDTEGEEDEMFFAQRYIDDNGQESTLLSGVTIADAVISGSFYGQGQMPYTSIKDGGAFVTADIPKDVSSVFLYFGQNLSYSPKVVCTLVLPEVGGDMYYFVLQNIQSHGTDVLFSDTVTNEGYSLDCFVSPRMIPYPAVTPTPPAVTPTP